MKNLSQQSLATKLCPEFLKKIIKINCWYKIITAMPK